MASKKQKNNKKFKKNKGANKSKPSRAPSTSTWIGTKAKANTLTGKGKFDPKVSIEQVGDEGDDDIIWADYPKALKERLENKPQQITRDCLQMNAKGILRLFENDIVQHVIKQQLRSEHMTNLLARQATYEESGRRGSHRATVSKLAKSSLLGRDPSGELPIPDEMWDGDDLTEQGTLLKDVQDAVWDYLRVHLPRILSKKIHDRVKAQEGLYKDHPELKETLHNERMPWSEYKQVITYMLPKATGMYELARLLTLEREAAETAKSWATRLNKGKQKIFKRMKSNLSDACYAELLMEGLTAREKAEMIKAQIDRTISGTYCVGDQVMANWSSKGKYYPATVTAVHDNDNLDVRYAPPFQDDEEIAIAPNMVRPIGRGLQQAKSMQYLRQAPWASLLSYVSRDIGPQPYYQVRPSKPAHKLYTYEQAMELGGDKKRQRVREKREQEDRSGRPPNKNRKAEQRQQANKEQNRTAKAEDENEGDTDLKHICLDCKEKGRRYNHNPDTCNYREGGPWHGLEGDELKKAKKEFFEKKKEQKRLKRKRRRESRKVKTVTFLEPTFPWDSSDEDPPTYTRNTRIKVTVSAKKHTRPNWTPDQKQHLVEHTRRALASGVIRPATRAG